MLSPPRERPSASRSTAAAGVESEFLSFDPAPCVTRGRRRSRHQRHQPLRRHVLGWVVPGSSRVPVRPDHGRVHANRPLRPGVAVTTGLQRRQDHLPGAIGGPAPMPPMQGSEVPIAARHIPPRRPGPGPPQDPVDHLPVIVPPASAARRPVRQQRLQPKPLHISQIMTIEHEPGLPNPPLKIGETRPRRCRSPSAGPELPAVHPGGRPWRDQTRHPRAEEASPRRSCVDGGRSARPPQRTLTPRGGARPSRLPAVSVGTGAQPALHHGALAAHGP